MEPLFSSSAIPKPGASQPACQMKATKRSSHFVPLQRPHRKRRQPRYGAYERLRSLIMGFFLLDRIEYKNVLVWIATYHYVPLHACIIAVLLNCILHIFFHIIFPLLQETKSWSQAQRQHGEDTTRDVHNVPAAVYMVVTHTGFLFGVGIVGYKLLSTVTDAMIDSCLVVSDDVTSLTVGFYGLLYDYRLIYHSPFARAVFATVSVAFLGTIVVVFFGNFLVEWEPNDGIVFWGFVAVMLASVAAEVRNYYVNVLERGAVSASAYGVTLWWRKAIPRTRRYCLNVIIVLSVFAASQRTAMYGFCCFCEGAVYLNLVHIVLVAAAKVTLFVLKLREAVAEAVAVRLVGRIYGFLVLPWLAVALSAAFYFPPMIAAMHLPPVLILMNSVSSYIQVERELRERQDTTPQYTFPDSVGCDRNGDRMTSPHLPPATPVDASSSNSLLSSCYGSNGDINGKSAHGECWGHASRAASHDEWENCDKKREATKEECTRPPAVEDPRSPLPMVTDSQRTLAELSLISLALRLYLCHRKVRNFSVPHYNMSLLFRSVHRISISAAVLLTLALGIWVSVLNPSLDRPSPTTCAASPDGNRIRVSARYMMAELYGLDDYPTDPRSLVYEADHTHYDVRRFEGLCSRFWGELHAGDLAYFSLMAYLQRNSTDFKEMLDFYRRFRHGAGDWVALPTNHSYGRAIFRHLYSASKNTSVIAIRGTDVSEPFDFLQNMLLFGETFIFKMLSLILPLSSFIPERVIVDFVAAANAISAMVIGVNPHTHYYHLHIEQYLDQVHSENVIITGHSLGGVIAHIVAARRGLQGVAFSSPGINLMRKKLGIAPDSIDAYTTNVIVSNDFTVAIDQPGGSVHHIQCEHKTAEICHSIELHAIRMWTVCQQYRALTRLNGTYYLTP